MHTYRLEHICNENRWKRAELAWIWLQTENAITYQIRFHLFSLQGYVKPTLVFTEAIAPQLLMITPSGHLSR